MATPPRSLKKRKEQHRTGTKNNTAEGNRETSTKFHFHGIERSEDVGDAGGSLSRNRVLLTPSSFRSWYETLGPDSRRGTDIGGRRRSLASRPSRKISSAPQRLSGNSLPSPPTCPRPLNYV